MLRGEGDKVRHAGIAVLAATVLFGVTIGPTFGGAGFLDDPDEGGNGFALPADDGIPASVDEELRVDAFSGTEVGAGDPDPIDIIVRFTDPGVPAVATGDTDSAVAALQSLEEQRWQSVEQELEALEEEGLLTVLNRFWITSAVLVSASPTEELLDRLAGLPGAEEVLPNFTVEPLQEVVSPNEAGETTEHPRHGTLTWGVDRVGAPDVWDDFGVTGEGVRVAVLDTGVDATHPDIGPSLVGADLNDPTYPGGWITFDSRGLPIATGPSDPGSHGTHVAGTIVGGDASGVSIGVAPGASLMAANVLSGAGGGSYARILAGLQWALEPHSGHSTSDRVGRPANVINMSLGSTGHSAAFADIIRNVRDAGIFPAIAIGNAPCGPTGNSSPGDLFEAVGVGMTNADNEVDPGSCGARTNWPTEISERYDWPQGFMKPDVSAPGAAVYSAMPDGRYGLATGTSMATPHVAAAAALIASAQGGLTVDQIQEALEATGWLPEGHDGQQDSRFGHGEINVHDAISRILGASGISGTVLDAETGESVVGAVVSYGEVSETWTTDDYGQFRASLPAGSYELSIERFGYETGTASVTVETEDDIASVTINLVPRTTGVIEGSVLDRTSGEPIEGARIGIVGHPASTTSTADGSYSFDDLPAGEYTLVFSAEGMTTATSPVATVKVAHLTVVNAELSPHIRVLLIGSGDAARTAELLENHEAEVTRVGEIPADFAPDEYDTVVFDSSIPVETQTFANFVAALEAAGIGVVWLDLGTGDNSGIAQLSSHTGNPAVRGTDNDRTVTATGYRVTTQHPIFAGGQLSGSIQPGDLVFQNTQASGPKNTAWFEGLTGAGSQVLARTVAQQEDGSIAELGDGIGIIETANQRSVLLSLHGSSSAIGVRNWSPEAAQLLVNSVGWASPDDMQPLPPVVYEPEPIGPLPPDPDPDPDDPGSGGPPNDKPTTPWQPSPSTGGQGGSDDPRLAPNQQQQQAPQQAQPKPTTEPAPPFGSVDELRSSSTGGITATLDGDELVVLIPDAEPGEWYYLHIYPHMVGIDWIRVNDDGELRINIGSLQPGTYFLAFTAADGTFAGWYELEIEGEPQAAPQDDVPAAVEPNDTEDALGQMNPNHQGASGALTPLEQGLLLGAAGLLLAAAAVIVFAALRKKQVVA